MDKLEDTSIIKFRPNTLEQVRTVRGLDKYKIDQSLDILQKWLLKQDHLLKKDYSKPFLERCLVNCKGSVERTKKKIDKISTIRTLLPTYFKTFDASIDFEPFRGTIWHALLPQLTAKNERVYFIKVYPFQPPLLSFYNLIYKILEYLNLYDYSTGIHFFLDYTEVNIVELAKKFHLQELQHSAEITLNGYSMSIKSITIVTPSSMVDIIISLFKAVLNDKISKRIRSFKDWESCQAEQTDVPTEILPKEYGGQEKSLKELHDDLMSALGSDNFVKHLKEQAEGVSDEKLRSSYAFNQQHMGMPGSFKQMTVD